MRRRARRAPRRSATGMHISVDGSGRNQLTRIPSRATSLAKPVVNVSTAPFDAAYTNRSRR